MACIFITGFNQLLLSVMHDTTKRIRIGWIKWRSILGVLYDFRVPIKLKVKFCRLL